MLRRDFLTGLASTLSLGAAPNEASTKIAFGSCANQDWGQPVWDTIRSLNPAAMVLLGDNIYADTEDMNYMASCYDKLEAIPEFARLRRQVQMVATWDDHDFGCNDSGREYSRRHESKQLFLDFFKEPALSMRRHRPGVYTSYMVGRAPYDVQIILLDLRWFRSPLIINGHGHYQPAPNITPELLGDDQWLWLERELRKPAGARLIGSSIQFVSSEHRWEKWANFASEKQKLELLLEQLDIRNAVIISGDMHFGEISSQELGNGFELFDFTSSGLNLVESCRGIPNSQRLAVFDRAPNFGLIDINWAQGKLTGEIRDYAGTVRAALDVALPVPTV